MGHPRGIEPRIAILEAATVAVRSGAWYSRQDSNLHVDTRFLNRVETITELTDLADTAFPLLTHRYGPLQRVTEYVRIAAFFRWARKRGNLLAVALATLGEVPPRQARE